MGLFIIITAVVVVIGITIFCIITKSYQEKVRGMIRIAAFAAFVLFTVIQVIDWGLRYYALGILLFILAITGVLAVTRNRAELRTYKPGQVIWKAVEVIALFFLVTLPAIIFPQYKEIHPTGPYQVGTVINTYTDTSRVETYTRTGENRKLTVELWYPENADGTFPLIVFSHGGNGVKTSNPSLFNELASHGYIVGSIDHTYQSLFTRDTDGKTTLIDMDYMQDLLAEDPEASKQQSYEYYQQWMKIRTDDINFVIDHLLAETSNPDGDQVYKLVDPMKIGVMGHSLGGSAALGIGRMRQDIGAVLELDSPFLCDVQGVKDGEFVFTAEEYPKPLLNVYSDDVWNHLGQWPQYAENDSLLSATNPTIFNAHIRGTGHFSLTDLALTSPYITQMFNEQKSTRETEYVLELINKISLDFFDAYLKGEGQFISAGTY